MPLITESIFEAKAAYADLELRSQASLVNVATLQSTVDHLTMVHSVLVDRARQQGEYTSQQIVANATLTANQAVAVSPDVSLANFIASLGLSVALAEATMPDRAINSVSASVQSFLTFMTGPDGVTKIPGLRLYQPELGASGALATTSFDLAKVGATPGSPAPRSLYAVLMEKQALFSDPFWTKFVGPAPAGGSPPPVPPALQIVAEIVQVFANVGAWTFPYLLQQATTIAGLETSLSAALGGASLPPDKTGAVADYSAAVGVLTTLVTALNARANHVAGDLYALTAALDATAKVASSLQT